MDQQTLNKWPGTSIFKVLIKTEHQKDYLKRQYCYLLIALKCAPFQRE